MLNYDLMLYFRQGNRAAPPLHIRQGLDGFDEQRPHCTRTSARRRPGAQLKNSFAVLDSAVPVMYNILAPQGAG